MQTYEYKHVSNMFSAAAVLREVEEHERNGWILFSMESGFASLFGCGGSTGLIAVVRRPCVPDTSETVASAKS